MISPLFKKNKLGLTLFVLPVVLLFSLVVLIPLIQSFVMSFTKWDGVNAPQFNGIDNYLKLIDSRDTGISIKNSLIYSVVLTIYQIGLATIFAFVLVNCEIRFKKAFRNIYFFPVLLSVSVVAQLWISMYHGDFGLINQFAKLLGFEWQQNWLTQPTKGIIAITIADAWKGMGYHMLIIYAAMKSIPESYYEASVIDGANLMQQFFRVTIPLSASTIRVSFVLCMTFGFRAFEMIFLMTAGGPGNLTTTMSIMMYKAMFRTQEYGYGSAVATVIVIISVSMMLVINKLTDHVDNIY